MSHEILFSITVLFLVGLAFILAKLTGRPENINKY